jgi:hypothetical protein
MWHDRGPEAVMDPESQFRHGLLARTLFETLRDAASRWPPRMPWPAWQAEWR